MKTAAFKLTAITDVGLVRKNNEDNFIVCPDLQSSEWIIPQNDHEPIELSSHGCVFAVADGMGGLNAGEVASAIAIEQVRRSFTQADLDSVSQSDKKIEKFLKSVITDADKAIKKHVKESPDSKGMGTTLIVGWVVMDRVHICWCGDSRAYIFNTTSGLTRFSKDHSYVQELVDKGFLDPDLAFDHPDSNIITRCLGDFQDSASPDYKNYYLQPGDFVLLCSDGLCGYCRDEEIQSVMFDNYTDFLECSRQLIRHALDAGGSDNVTLTLFELSEKKGISDTKSNQGNNENIESDEDKTSETTQVTLEPKSTKSSKVKVLITFIFLIVLAYLYLKYWKHFDFIGCIFQRLAHLTPM